MRQKMYLGLRIAALLVFAGAVAAYAGAIWLARGSWPGLFLYALAFLLTVLLPGLAICGLLLPSLRGAALPVAASVTGAALLMLLYIPFGLLGLPALSGIPAAALGLWCLFRKRHNLKSTLHRLWNAPPALWLLLCIFAGVMVLFAFSGVLDIAWPSANWHYVYPQDSLWSVGNAAAVQWGFPLRDIRFAGGVLHYHYFSEAIAGLLSLFSWQTAWDSVLYFNWPIWAGLLLLGGWALGRRLGAGPLPALLLPLSAAFYNAGFAGSAVHFFRNPNMVVQSYVYLLACLLLFSYIETDGAARRWPALLPMALAALALVWGKSTTGATLFLALLVAWGLWCAVHRRLEKRWLAAILAGAAVTVLLFATLLSGGVTQVEFGFSPQALLSILQQLLVSNWLLGIPYALSAVYCLVRIRKVSVTCLAMHAMVVGGLLAYSMINHYGGSQTYFYLTALFLMPYCIIEGVAAIPWAKPRWAAALATALCVAVSLGLMNGQLVGWVKSGTGAAIRSLRRGALIDYTNLTMSAEDEEAALWLRDNMRPDEVFATNRGTNIEHGNDGIMHFYSAVSQRQCFMEGWQYALDYSVPYWTYYHRRYDVVNVLYKLVTFDEANALAKAQGIHYLVVHRNTRFGVPFEGGEPVFENSDVWIYKVE